MSKKNLFLNKNPRQSILILKNNYINMKLYKYYIFNDKIVILIKNIMLNNKF